MRSLADRLGIPVHAAVGIMEMLWHHAGDYAPRGDIGKLSDRMIAQAVDWKGDVGTLVEALVAERWIDRDEEYRLVVHDWEDHCEEFVRKRIFRSGEAFIRPKSARPVQSQVYFIQGKDSRRIKIGFTEGDVERRRYELQTGSAEELVVIGQFKARRSEENKIHKQFIHLSVGGEWFLESEELTAFISGKKRQPLSASKTKTSATVAPRAGHRQGTGKAPAQASVSPEEENLEVSPAEILTPFEGKLREVAARIHDRHPAIRRCGPKDVRDRIRSICSKLIPTPERLARLDEIDANHAAWCATEQWQKDGGEFAKGLDNWLAPTKDRWATAPPESPPGGLSHTLSKSEQSLAKAAMLFESGVMR